MRSVAGTDWVEYLGLNGYCCSFVRRIDERNSLLRMGIEPERILTMAHREIAAAAVGNPRLKPILAIRLGDWTLVVEHNGVRGLEKILALSEGTEAIATHRGPGADRSFRYARDGVMLTAFDDSVSGHLVGWGEDPTLLAPFIEQLGRDLLRPTDQDDLELACLVAGASPREEDFRGPLLCAISE
jgi:hypothetical protein